MNGDSTWTMKLKLPFKVATKLPFRRVKFVNPTVQFTLRDFFPLFLNTFVFQTLPCMNFFLFFFFSTPGPITVMVRSADKGNCKVSSLARSVSGKKFRLRLAFFVSLPLEISILD